MNAHSCVAESRWAETLALVGDQSPASAQALGNAALPGTVETGTGRDGSPTVRWVDESGGLRWLGRTTMPAVRGAALVESFQPGGGNVLLCGAGQGEEIRLLLKKLARHQAVFVVEEDAAAAALVLRLHDFGAALRDGRLAVFAGAEAWADLERFLSEETGYLVPDRVLAWPWFTHEDVARVTERLLRLGAAVAANRRAAQLGARGPGGQGARGQESEGRKIAECGLRIEAVDDAPFSQRACSPHWREVPGIRKQESGVRGQESGIRSQGGGVGDARRVAIISNIPDSSVLQLAQRIEVGATALGWSARRFVLDSPAWVHPAATQTALASSPLDLILLLGVTPGQLPYPLPSARLAILLPDLHRSWTGATQADETILRAVPEGGLLGLASAGQREWLSRQLPTTRALVVPPAALPGLESVGPLGDRLLIVADGGDGSAAAAGLNLVSHQRLWEAASQTIVERADRYRDDDAGAVLRDAERRLGMTLRSEEVRAGLTERIRRLLGPALVRRTHLRALIAAGAAFDLYGEGWEDDAEFAAFWRGPWPGVTAHRSLTVATQESLRGAWGVASLETDGSMSPAVLDALAAGRAALVRRHARDVTQEGWSALVDPDESLYRFGSVREVVDLARRRGGDPAQFGERAARTARRIQSAHTWATRLRMIEEAIRGGA